MAQSGASVWERLRQTDYYEISSRSMRAPRIPTHFLREGLHDGYRPLQFRLDDLSADIARGRAAVPLSRIAQQCPEVFRGPISEDDDILVRLPLQKLVEQIGKLQQTGGPDRTGRATGGNIASNPASPARIKG
jgi:hypothetical protein